MDDINVSRYDRGAEKHPGHSSNNYVFNICSVQFLENLECGVSG